MPKITINDIGIEVDSGLTVIQACEAAGIEIPRFCYHERLSISGNCRMCLVEMEPSPRPIASCAMPVMDGMVIRTNTPMVEKARKSALEFLLINHPLDCPICDQGGECDLQDITMAYGADQSRFKENKRAVPEKDFGPLVATAMTRCIHCTRCVRFSTEVAGVEEMGATGRGENTEVGTYVQMAVSSEMSGNMIDLCPVGALNSKPYAFTARSWELRHTKTVDVLDAVGSNIRVDSRGSEIMRVLPRIHEDVNEEWISDKTRFSYDGLKRQRLDRPYVRKDGRLREASWEEAFASIASRIGAINGEKGRKIAAIAGDMACCESIQALKDIMDGFESPHMDCRQDGAKLDPGVRAGYIFNTSISGIESADLCLLIGTNPRIEAPIINARLRKRFLMGGFSVALVGGQADLTYAYEYLGSGPRTLEQILSRSHMFAELMDAAQRPMLILGQEALARPDGAMVLAAAHNLADQFGMVNSGWNGFNVLHRAAARVGAMDIGFVPGEGGHDVAGILEAAANGEMEVVYLLGADEIETVGLGSAFVIYQGHHGDAGAAVADVVLPGAAYTEKDATYINTEGRVQQSHLAVHPPGQARPDWMILRALSQALGQKTRYDSLEEVRAQMIRTNAVFAEVDVAAAASTLKPNWAAFGTSGKMNDSPFVNQMENFYMTDPISRASETMARCTDTFIVPHLRIMDTNG
jgi:NADH-quinone oxidoreductase subunit G